MKDRAEIVVVGAGICGASIALHLARLGRPDVTVLEQGELVSGTTSHAPGLVGQLRSSAALTRMLRGSVALYRTLELDGIQGFDEVGSLRLASSTARMEELRRQERWAQECGLEAHLLSPGDALALFPAMSEREIEGALYIPSDGSATATVLAGAMIREARSRGVTFQPHARVTAIERKGGRVSAVETTAGRIETEALVVACGIWSPAVAQLAGVSVPLVPMQHQYHETEPLSEILDATARLGKPLPNVRDPDKLVYARVKNGGLSVGGYERNPRAWSAAIPVGENPTVLAYDAAHFAPLWEAAVERFPMLAESRPTKQVNGLESFTPDGAFLLGPIGAVPGMWIACGFCAHGVSAGGGVGQAMAEWILQGKPQQDLSGMEIGRFGATPPAGEELVSRVRRVYGTYYDVAPLS
jgi:4-methylaminobutanoate oxidase (formaldehyde-forming)